MTHTSKIRCLKRAKFFVIVDVVVESTVGYEAIVKTLKLRFDGAGFTWPFYDTFLELC